MPEVAITWKQIDGAPDTWLTLYQQYAVYVFRSQRFRNRYVWVIFLNSKRNKFIASSEKEGDKMGFSSVEAPGGAGESAIRFLNEYIGKKPTIEKYGISVGKKPTNVRNK